MRTFVSSGAIALAISSLTMACAPSSHIESPASEPPPAQLDSAATVTATIDAPIDRVFDYVVAKDTPEVLGSYGPIPAVKGSVLLDGAWDHPNVHRVVVLDGGSTLHEEITDFRRPNYFAYKINAFTNALSALAREGRGTWRFTPNGNRTDVSWTYAFRAATCPSKPALSVFVAEVYRPFMEQGMGVIKVNVERAQSSSAPRLAARE